MHDKFYESVNLLYMQETCFLQSLERCQLDDVVASKPGKLDSPGITRRNMTDTTT